MSANTDETKQVDLSGEQTDDRTRSFKQNLCGCAKVLWEVGADDAIDDGDEFAEVYERCVDRGHIDAEGDR